MQNIIFILKFIKYKLFAKHGKGYGIHSPFLYSLLTETVFNKINNSDFEAIERIRKVLLKNSSKIKVSDIGAGSKKMKSEIRKISDTVLYSAIKPKFGKVLYNLAKRFNPKTVLELGTSLGISTLYLANAVKNSKIYTIENCAETAKIAAENFKMSKLKNIEQYVGNIDEILPQLISSADNFDFVFFDANHKEEPVLKYFNLCLSNSTEKSIFVFDDIHWSKGMENAWNKIKACEKVTLSVDLFFFGIVFFDENLSKQDFIIKF